MKYLNTHTIWRKAEKENYISIHQNGDLNNNGIIDIGDVSRVAYMVAGKIPENLEADFNGNGVVDIGDASKIAYYFIGNIREL